MFWLRAHAGDPLQQGPPLGIGGQRPGLIHRQHRVAGGVGGAEAQRVGGEQAQHREADPLLLQELGASRAGQRQGEVSDPQRDDLGIADLGHAAIARAEAELGEAAGGVGLHGAGGFAASALGEAAIRASTSPVLLAPPPPRPRRSPGAAGSATRA